MFQHSFTKGSAAASAKDLLLNWAANLVCNTQRQEKKSPIHNEKAGRKAWVLSQKTSCNQNMLQLLLISMTHNSLFTKPY